VPCRHAATPDGWRHGACAPCACCAALSARSAAACRPGARARAVSRLPPRSLRRGACFGVQQLPCRGQHACRLPQRSVTRSCDPEGLALLARSLGALPEWTRLAAPLRGRVPADAAVGRLSAALLCPYPPGVPVALPGEALTAEGLATLRAVLAAGGKVTGAADDSLNTLLVIAEHMRT